MKLKNQVVSLDIAKRLKELGVKQESLFWWDFRPKVGESKCDWHVMLEKQLENKYMAKSAFTVAELGDMLPDVIKLEKGNAYFTQEKTIEPTNKKHLWEVFYEYFYDEGGKISEQSDTEADARGKMLIYLLENKLITL